MLWCLLKCEFLLWLEFSNYITINLVNVFFSYIMYIYINYMYVMYIYYYASRAISLGIFALSNTVVGVLCLFLLFFMVFVVNKAFDLNHNEVQCSTRSIVCIIVCVL